jgi:hypothetical protein
MLLGDQISGLHAAGTRARRRRGARRVVGVVALFVIAVAAIHAQSAGAILVAYETGIQADTEQSPGIDDCLECGEACVRAVTCTVFGIVNDAALAPLAAKWAWIDAPAEFGPSRATAPPLRPPVMGFEHSRESG